MAVRSIIRFVFCVFLLIFSRAGLFASNEVRVALCQIFCLDGDRSGNFVRVENALREAKKGGADIACFPETALFGWVNPDAFSRACAVPGEDSERICRLAAEYKIHICIGLAEKVGDRLFDSVVLVDQQGDIILKHRKINVLGELMTPGYTPGEKIAAVDTEYGRIGLLICADTFKENILKQMADLKPDLLLVPYGWAAPETDWPEHGQSLQNVIKKAAQKTGAYVVGTDLVGEITKGPWAGYIYGGQSAVVDNKGKLLYTARDRDRDIKVVLLSFTRRPTPVPT